MVLIKGKWNRLSLTLLFNTFASQRLVFWGKNEPFILENALNLSHEFLYDHFNKKNFVKCSFKIVILMCQIWCIFMDKWMIFSSKTKPWEAKVLMFKELYINQIWKHFSSQVNTKNEDFDCIFYQFLRKQCIFE